VWRVESKSLTENVPKEYLQLIGRILPVFVVVTMFLFGTFFVQMVGDVSTNIGYKTKLSAVVFFTWPFVLNVYFNAWWNVPACMSPCRTSSSTTSSRCECKSNTVFSCFWVLVLLRLCQNNL
jgi:hypothetical protein